MTMHLVKKFYNINNNNNRKYWADVQREIISSHGERDIMEIAEVIERSRKDKLPAIRNVPKKKLLEETAKVDKVLSTFKAHSITKTNELFHAGAVFKTHSFTKTNECSMEEKLLLQID